MTHITVNPKGFNNPDGRKQANMSIQEALALWPILEKQTAVSVAPPCSTKRATLQSSENSTPGIRTEAEKRTVKGIGNTDFQLLH